jgi:Sec-independent protein translocase protein TatA
MLDLGLTKMAVIGVVALVVLGPERLPGVARTAGALFGARSATSTTSSRKSRAKWNSMS